MIKLFVVGLPLDFNETELLALFKSHGSVIDAQLLTDKITLKSKGFGFVEMDDDAEADQAISKLNGIVIRGRKISVKVADEDRSKKPRTFTPMRVEGDQKNTIPTEGDISTKRPRRMNLQNKKV
jgi:RNA recognition motif-containing protein